jgi:hypothetical protein
MSVLDASCYATQGYASPEVLAFNQEAPSRAASLLGKLWEEVRDLFGQADTVNDRLKKAVENKLTPDERAALGRQEKEFHRKQMESLRTGMSWGADGPDLNDYPLIGKRDQMLRDAEQEICHFVRNSMSHAEKQELDLEFFRYGELMKAYRESPIFKPRPRPGLAIQRFYQNVGSAVEKFGAV